MNICGIKCGSGTPGLIKSLEMEGSNRVQVTHFPEGETQVQRGDSMSMRSPGSTLVPFPLFSGRCLGKFSVHPELMLHELINTWGLSEIFAVKSLTVSPQGTSERGSQKMTLLCVCSFHTPALIHSVPVPSAWVSTQRPSSRTLTMDLQQPLGEGL